MVFYANVFSDSDEEAFGMTKVSGAHFFQDIDPENAKNKVLKVFTWNTITNLPSTTRISANRLSPTVSCCEFEMKYRFNVIPWLFWSRYYVLELRAKNDVPQLSVVFSAIDHKPEGGGTASKLAMRIEDEIIQSTTMCAEKWYDIRIEYYPNKKIPISPA